MKRIIKRPDLVGIIIRKTGIPGKEASLGYLTKKQLKALIVFIENTESKIHVLSEEVRTLTESIKNTYGKDESRP